MNDSHDIIIKLHALNTPLMDIAWIHNQISNQTFYQIRDQIDKVWFPVKTQIFKPVLSQMKDQGIII